MIEIIPAILTDSPARFKELIRKIEPYTRRAHIDIADGVFVPNKTIKAYEELKEVESALKFDIHLMVQRPQDQIKEWFHTHADRFLIHAESEVDLNSILDEIREHDRKVGLVLNPETEVDKIKEFIGKIDYIQFMTIHPGFQGSEFLDEVVGKIASFHKEYPEVSILVDGGVTPGTAPKLVMAGVSTLISGSYIVNSSNVQNSIEELKESCTT